MSFPNDRTYSFDANLQLSDNAAAYAASGWTQVGGAQAIIDLGGNQGATPVQNARIDAVAIVDVTAIDISSGNETYKVLVVGSNDPGLATGNVCLGAIELCVAGAGDVPNNASNVTGRAEIMFTNNLAGNFYEYVGLYLVIAGTTPSINIESFIAVLPEP